MKTRVTAALIGVLLGLPIATWSYDREPPVQQINNYANPGTARRGDFLIVESQVVRKETCPVHIDVLIFDGKNTRWSLPSYDSQAIGFTGVETFRTAYPLPVSAAAGPSKLRFTFSWSCNPVQALFPVVTVVDVPFEIN